MSGCKDQAGLGVPLMGCSELCGCNTQHGVPQEGCSNQPGMRGAPNWGATTVQVPGVPQAVGVPEQAGGAGCDGRPRTRCPLRGGPGQLRPPPHEGLERKKQFRRPGGSLKAPVAPLPSQAPRPSLPPESPPSSLSPAPRRAGSFNLPPPPPPPHPPTSLAVAQLHRSSPIPGASGGLRMREPSGDAGGLPAPQRGGRGAGGARGAPDARHPQGPAPGRGGRESSSGEICLLLYLISPQCSFAGSSGCSALAAGARPGASLAPSTPPAGLGDVPPHGCAGPRAGLWVPVGGWWCSGSRGDPLTSGAEQGSSWCQRARGAHRDPEDRVPSLALSVG